MASGIDARIGLPFIVGTAGRKAEKVAERGFGDGAASQHMGQFLIPQERKEVHRRVRLEQHDTPIGFDSEIHSEEIKGDAVAHLLEDSGDAWREGVLRIGEQLPLLGDQLRSGEHEAAPVLGVDIPMVGRQHVAKDGPPADEEDPIFAVDTVGAAEIGELGRDAVALALQANPEIAGGLEAADDPAGVRSRFAEDDRVGHPCLLDRAHRNVGLPGPQPYGAGNVKPLDPR